MPRYLVTGVPCREVARAAMSGRAAHVGAHIRTDPGNRYTLRSASFNTAGRDRRPTTRASGAACAPAATQHFRRNQAFIADSVVIMRRRRNLSDVVLLSLERILSIHAVRKPAVLTTPLRYCSMFFHTRAWLRCTYRRVGGQLFSTRSSFCLRPVACRQRKRCSRGGLGRSSPFLRKPIAGSRGSRYCRRHACDILTTGALRRSDRRASRCVKFAPDSLAPSSRIPMAIDRHVYRVGKRDTSHDLTG